MSVDERVDCVECGHRHYDAWLSVYVPCPLAPECDCQLGVAETGGPPAPGTGFQWRGEALADRLMDDYSAAVEDRDGVRSLLIVAYLHGVETGAHELGTLISAELAKL